MNRRRRTRLRVVSSDRFVWTRERRPTLRAKQIRYAVVGMGHIAQVAVLPAFKNAARNSRLVAIISDDETKRRQLAGKYRVPITGSYAEYNKLLESGNIDAVYIAEPNSLHLSFATRAAQAGIHVLCEKPLATTESECRKIIDSCKQNNVKLMTAYRLHFEKANLEAIRVLQSGKLGEPRYFNSTFSMQVREGNIRLKKELGGGPLYDIGIYCINATRYIFRDEPFEVMALSATGKDKRFKEVEEMIGAILRFPGERLATFTSSFGAADESSFMVAGTKGTLKLKNGYEYSEASEMQITIGGKTQTRTFSKRDQFAPELLYFSDCILRNKEPEPSGIEGLNDVRIIQALHQSAAGHKAICLPNLDQKRVRPSIQQHIRRPAIRKPALVRAKSAGKG